MTLRPALAAACTLCWLAAQAALAEPGALPPFSEAEVRRILAHGPWPPPQRTDPSNRVSGDAQAIALGALLFCDTRLSRTSSISCASCHQPDRDFGDGLALAKGIERVDRNTPSLANVGFQRWYGWDGAGDSLWAQSLRPIVDSREMGGGLASIAGTIRSDRELVGRYRAAFGVAPSVSDEAVAVNAAKALAAYQETLVSGRTPFDDFRDALARGDRVAADAYPEAARRGLAIFIGKGRCDLCHSGPRFSNGEFHDTGIPFFVAPGRVDPGRFEGIRRVKGSRYNLMGAYSDDPTRSTASGTRYVALEHRNFGEFKVPSLRNVARTAPYMHNGSLATLRDVVLHYSEIDEDRLHADGERILMPLHLSESEIADLQAFLESLSDRGEPRAPLTVGSNARREATGCTGSAGVAR
jgi:cytochrome c peroxidase